VLFLCFALYLEKTLYVSFVFLQVSRLSKEFAFDFVFLAVFEIDEGIDVRCLFDV
jgi:L-ribulose-5-phosphate 3-epimerase UlaE